ncbi:DUF2752 domain-containing protein [Winogradskyella maritima]|nr:DUF2752 domain-containing protein [Winogradskyella maritima]
MWKKTFNVECMGCGIQRSFSLVIQGKFTEAFFMYPAIYTLMLMVLILVLHIKFQFKNGHKILLGLFILNIVIIVVNYITKIT